MGPKMHPYTFPFAGLPGALSLQPGAGSPGGLDSAAAQTPARYHHPQGAQAAGAVAEARQAVVAAAAAAARAAEAEQAAALLRQQLLRQQVGLQSTCFDHT